jgi:mycofactocin system transcriptional regulator
MGRPPATSRDKLERAAFELFFERGYEQTTVEEIAAAAGIARRTFFRYFATKNDVVWGDFQDHLNRLRSDLAAVGPDVPVTAALIESIIGFNDYPAEELPRHRQRMHLILGTADLQAHSTLQFAKWRQVIADFVASRCGCPASDLGPQVVGHTALGACLAAYEAWMDGDAGDLTGLLRRALTGWTRVMQGGAWPAPLGSQEEEGADTSGGAVPHTGWDPGTNSKVEPESGVT